METQIIIQPQIPYCTIKKFAELTGNSEAWIKQEIREGRIATLPKSGAKAKVQINLQAEWEKAVLNSKVI